MSTGSPARQPALQLWRDILEYSPPIHHIEKRERLRAVAAQFGADLRTAALQFSAAPDVAVALIVGAHTEAQVLANVSSMQSTIPPEFWAELKTAEPYRAERAHNTYGVAILKTGGREVRQDELIVGEVCLAFTRANENL